MQSAYFFAANFIWSTVRTAPHSGVHTLHVHLVHVRQYKTKRSWIVNNLIEAPFILPMFTLFLYSNFTGFFSFRSQWNFLIFVFPCRSFRQDTIHIPSRHPLQISSVAGTAPTGVAWPATAGSGVVWFRAFCPKAGKSGAQSSGNQLFQKWQIYDLKEWKNLRNTCKFLELWILLQEN